MPTRFIDTHCHLDAPEFDADRAEMRRRAAEAGVALCVIPAVAAFNFDTVRELAHAQGDAYALGIHPLCAGSAGEADLAALDAALAAHRDDPRLVAVGEIGLDYFAHGLEPGRQERIFEAQLRLARRHGLRVGALTNNWRRDGFSDAEIESLDDRLIDAVVACGDLSVVKARLDAYFTAGADHVCLQPIGPNGMVPDIERDRIAWRELATLI